jgi:hypothetical protein
MISGKEAIVRQAKMGVVVAADQKCVVFIERKHASFIRSCQDSEIYLHGVGGGPGLSIG